jgi:hypothetical protein
MNFFGIVYLITTTFILLFKKEENNHSKIDEVLADDYPLIDTYKLIWSILKLKPILKLIFILFTIRVRNQIFFFYFWIPRVSFKNLLIFQS